MLIDDQYPVAAEKSVQKVLEGMIRNIYQLDSEIHQVINFLKRSPLMYTDSIATFY